MTDNQFSTYSFRHSEIIVYHQQHPDEDVECMLIGVNFDHGLFHLVPFDQEIYETPALKAHSFRGGMKTQTDDSR